MKSQTPPQNLEDFSIPESFAIAFVISLIKNDEKYSLTTLSLDISCSHTANRKTSSELYAQQVTKNSLFENHLKTFFQEVVKPNRLAVEFG